MERKHLELIRSGHGAVQQGHSGANAGRDGGVRPSAYAAPALGVTPPPMVGIRPADARHTATPESIPGLRRPDQDYSGDHPSPYRPAQIDRRADATGRPPRGQEHVGGRTIGTRRLTDGTVPVMIVPPSTGIETDLTGRQPNAGRDVPLGAHSAPSVSGSYPNIPTGRGTVEQGHDGPRHPSGNSPGSFRPGGLSAGAESDRTVAAVFELARSRGGTPDSLGTPKTRMGGMRTSYESHDAGMGGVGVYPAGANRGGSMESHDGTRTNNPRDER
jgi:hypothetical protein